jgi:hypothetical protein
MAGNETTLPLPNCPTAVARASKRSHFLLTNSPAADGGHRAGLLHLNFGKPAYGGGARRKAKEKQNNKTAKTSAEGIP